MAMHKRQGKAAGWMPFALLASQLLACILGWQMQLEDGYNFRGTLLGRPTCSSAAGICQMALSYPQMPFSHPGDIALLLETATAQVGTRIA